MQGMGIMSTGVTVRDRETGNEYGFHAKCVTAFYDAISDANGPFGNERFVTIGPLFADASEWRCALAECGQVA